MHNNHVASPRSASRATRCTDTTSGEQFWDWVVVETLSGPDKATTVLDGPGPKSFTRIRNSTLGRSGAAVRLLPSLITQCASTGSAKDKCFSMPDGRIIRLVGVPILGPSGCTSAVAVWIGARTDTVPAFPAVGTIEWNAAGIMTTTPAAQWLLRLSYDAVPNVHTVPELLASFNHWDDRAGFFDLFNIENPSNQWTGTATKTFEDCVEHHLYFAARASGTRTNRIVRAVVCDITDAHGPISPDPCSIAFRYMPIPPGHALGLVDLKSGFVHEWLTEKGSPLSGWRHHNPIFPLPDQLDVITAVFELATGVRDVAEMTVRVRFDTDTNWIKVQARLKRIRGESRPQALLDVTPLSLVPPLAVQDCRICQYIDRATQNQVD